MKLNRFLISKYIYICICVGLLSCSHIQTENTSAIQNNLSSPDRSVAQFSHLSSDQNSAQSTEQTPWSYDPGPDPNSAMGKELIDIVAKQPNMPSLSMKLTGEQKFRPAFGPTLWRMIQKPNSIKILFIGQDGTHIAEAAGRTATAGFGGRAQDMARHFGVESSAAFMNTYAFTIKGQYAGRGALVVSEKNNTKLAQFNNTVVDNGIWMMSHDPKSPMVQWRNSLIDWIMRNNKESLRMVVLFGGSARDSIGTFIESRGGIVGSRYSKQDIKNQKIKVPRFTFESTGGNGEMPVTLLRDGRNIFQAIGSKIDFKNLTSENANVAKAAQAKLDMALKSFSEKISSYYPQLAIAKGGIEESGLIHPAQIGGYDLDKIQINGQTTISLKGLKLSDGSEIQNDVLVADFPHPTALSSLALTDKKAAEKKVEFSLATLKPYRAEGWRIEPDKGNVNKFDLSDKDENSKYKYGRADIPLNFYDFGTPQNRMVSVSSAYRMSGMSNVVVIGSRDKAVFNESELQSATKISQPAAVNVHELFTARPRTPTDRYVFDRGPGLAFAQLLKENLDISEIGKMKNGQTADEKCKKPEDISSFNVKTHPLCVGDFGHYRGTFKNPQVLILADPAGLDDLLTARALTGERGQYLQGLMNDFGVKDQYLILKTVPFGMSGATDEEWKTVLGQTNQYRKSIFSELLKNNIKLVIADGKYASAEIAELVQGRVPVVRISRADEDSSVGLAQAAADIAESKTLAVLQKPYDERMDVIPRSHLGFFSRVWEGTSGTRVFDATNKGDIGNVFAIVAPEWAYRQKVLPEDTVEENKQINTLNQQLTQLKLPLENESFSAYEQRLSDK